MEYISMDINNEYTFQFYTKYYLYNVNIIYHILYFDIIEEFNHIDIVVFLISFKEDFGFIHNIVDKYCNYFFNILLWHWY